MKMLKTQLYLSLCFFLFFLNSFAQDRYLFTIEKTTIELITDQKSQITASKNCFSLYSCQDLLGLDNIVARETKEKNGQSHPGLRYCVDIKGELVKAIFSQTKDEQLLCKIFNEKIKQDIYVTPGTLNFYALKNAKKNKNEFTADEPW